MASAIVLCAGFGTRLRPLTEELPKPLVPVGDRSILEHALGSLRRAGFAEAVINLHHLPEVFERHLSQQHREIALRVLVEPEIMGTAGGVAGARAHLQSAPVLVWNGDILVDPPLDQLLAGSEPHTLCLGVAPRTLGAGTVGLDAGGHVVRLRGERFGTEVSGGDYVGVLALGGELLSTLPARGCLFGDVALPLLRRGGVLRSVPVHSPWVDAGDLEHLLAANWAWLAARGLDGFTGKGAEVSRFVELRQSVVGAGAHVSGEGVLERCVVCPGASAVAPLRNAVVAPSGRVLPSHV